MLIGHQSGAHLCTLTVLELTLKRLLSDPDSLSLREDELPEQPPSFFASSTASSSLFASMAPLTFQVRLRQNYDSGTITGVFVCMTRVVFVVHFLEFCMFTPEFLLYH